MAKKKKQPTKKKLWEPMVKISQEHLEQQIEETRQRLVTLYPTLEVGWIIDKTKKNEMWGNDRYTAQLTFMDDNGRDGFVELSVHNHNRTTAMQWSHLQQIKNELVGPEREAVMMFPAESRLIDGANEYWLYIYPTGTAPMMTVRDRYSGEIETQPVGMNNGRNVFDQSEVEKFRALGTKPRQNRLQIKPSDTNVTR